MKPISVFLFLLLVSSTTFGLSFRSEEGDSIEVILIEAYSPKESPGKMVLTFFTSEPVKAEVIFSNKTVPLGTEFNESYSTTLEISDIPVTEGMIVFYIRVQGESGQINLSEQFDIVAEGNTTISGGADLTGCLIGSAVYAIPAVYYNFHRDSSGLGFGKEFPLISFFSGGYNYPNGFIAFEYTYTDVNDIKSRYNFGYKQIIEVPYINYVSLGFSFSTDFRGGNAVLPEASLGLFRIMNVFTLYVRGSHYVFPGDKDKNMTQFSLGLFSAFFSFQR